MLQITLLSFDLWLVCFVMNLGAQGVTFMGKKLRYENKNVTIQKWSKSLILKIKICNNIYKVIKL